MSAHNNKCILFLHNFKGKNVEKNSSLVTLEVSQSDINSSQDGGSDVTSSQDGGSVPSSSADVNMSTPDKLDENASETSSQQGKRDENIEHNENDHDSTQTKDDPREESDKDDMNNDADAGEVVTFKNGEIVSKEYINEGIFCQYFFLLN